MNLYEMAKQLASQDEVMDLVLFKRTILEISKDIAKNKYIMLLCNELKDFTIFHTNWELYCPTKNPYSFARELEETLLNRGALVHADKQKDGAWELWIRDLKTNENFAYYLFDYTEGIVEVNE